MVKRLPLQVTIVQIVRSVPSIDVKEKAARPRAATPPPESEL